MKIGVIGGGPAGIFSAIEASKTCTHVTLIDKNNFLGRKLSTTGGGKGNLTNINVKPESYSAIEEFVFDEIINKYDYDFLVDYFRNLGIYTYHTEDGWTYPISNSAKNVSSILESVIEQSTIEVLNGTTVIDINYVLDKFLLIFDNGKKMEFDKLIISTGGQAHPQLNASDSILKVLSRLGHKIIPAHPALSPLGTTKQYSKLLTGVRMDAETAIINSGKVVASTFGNIIFTDWGVNGPGIMDLSHHIFRHPGDNILQIKFSNIENKDVIKDLVQKFQHSNIKLMQLLLTLFPLKVANQLLINARFDLNTEIKNMGNRKFANFINDLSIEEKITGTRGFDFAQISTGAVASKDIDPITLQSKIIKNLCFAGEILDVIGPCGGYNLHWAFVSGIIAGRFITK